jgi:hypothetical protein
VNRSVPTEDQILVPETLLKKRKSQEKERASRAEELQKKREVSENGLSSLVALVMIATTSRLDLWSMLSLC